MSLRLCQSGSLKASDFRQLKAPHSYLNSGDRERFKPALRDPSLLRPQPGGLEKLLGEATASF